MPMTPEEIDDAKLIDGAVVERLQGELASARALVEEFSEECPTCGGSGMQVRFTSYFTQASQIAPCEECRGRKRISRHAARLAAADALLEYPVEHAAICVGVTKFDCTCGRNNARAAYDAALRAEAAAKARTSKEK